MFFHLANKFRYAIIAVRGYCDDFIYLPEGQFPPLLTKTSALYSEDRLRECMNRCIDAKGSIGYGSSGDARIDDQAFYIRKKDQHCACSTGTCTTRFDFYYSSYHVQHSDWGTICAKYYVFENMINNTRCIT